jgi:molybdopterin synthase catalytic subunit
MSDEVVSGAVICIKTLFFAAYRDIVGAEELDIKLPQGATLSDVVEVIRARPGGDALPPDPALAVNQEYASSNRVLENGDEVAFIPPVAGG